MPELKDISDFVEAGLIDREGLIALADRGRTWLEMRIDDAGEMPTGARRNDILSEIIPELAKSDTLFGEWSSRRR